MSRHRAICWGLLLIGLLVAAVWSGAGKVRADESSAAAEKMAASVTIVRDEWGVPHIEGPTDASVAFGFAYAQAEDYFWQIEDTYAAALGRYAELWGDEGVNADLLTLSFEIPQRAQADFQNIEAPLRAIAEGYTAGLNHYLAKHPEVKPRLIKRFEPWFMLAYERNVLLEFMFGKSHAPRGNVRKSIEGLQEAIGSNTWAIAPSRTKDKHAMLFANPHQPWFGYGQFYEGHVKSGEGLNFSGACFFGGPLPTIGHNEHLGWSHTVNDPDVADVWTETFDDPKNRKNYKYGDGYREATEWPVTLKIRTTDGFQEKQYTLRKTHHGPIVGSAGDNKYLAVQIAKLAEGSRLRQALKMTKAKNFIEWRAAMAELDLQMFNTCYADRDGNIFYVYNAAVPLRDPSFDWTKPVDGSNPKTEWQGILAFDDLPQILNPRSGYLQNCNSTPYTTTDDGNPSIGDFPAYMAEDRFDDKRRAKVSRMLLRNMHDITFEDWKHAAFDTTLYWPLVNIPVFARELEELEKSDPSLAARCKPLMEHLCDWDCRSAIDSTQTTLCYMWYEEMYGRGYPVETLKPEFVDNPTKKFEALATAAGKLKAFYGDWKIAWGDVSRIQRHANYADMAKIPFSDSLPSLPCAGAPGPLGVVFNTYYAPPTATHKKQYGVVGHSFVGVYEFGDKVQAATLLQFGACSNPESPHFMDQAELYSKQQFKPAWFHWDDVLAHAKQTYHPGAEGK
ncbi:MAG: penicillin acylase family protein [Pirellulales bacterium]